MLTTTEGQVSIWVGSLSEGALEAYVHETYDPNGEREAPMSAFCDDLGEWWYDHDVQEAHWVSLSQPVRELLEPLSRSEQYLPEAVRAAASRGIASGNVAILLVDCAYEGEWPEAAPLRFIGTFRAAYVAPTYASPQRVSGDGHDTRVTQIAIDAQRGMAVSGSFTGGLLRWDLATGRCLGAVESAHTGPVMDIAFNRAGWMLTTSSEVLLHAPDGSAGPGQRLFYDGGYQVPSVDVLENGDGIATSVSGEVSWFDLERAAPIGRLVVPLRTKQVLAIGGRMCLVRGDFRGDPARSCGRIHCCDLTARTSHALGDLAGMSLWNHMAKFAGGTLNHRS